MTDDTPLFILYAPPNSSGGKVITQTRLYSVADFFASSLPERLLAWPNLGQFYTMKSGVDEKPLMLNEVRMKNEFKKYFVTDTWQAFTQTCGVLEDG